MPSPRDSCQAADRQQSGVLALRAGVGLQADAGVARGLATASAPAAVQRRVALQLVARRERCTLANSGQVMGIISLVAFQLHRARPSGIIERSSARSLSARRAEVAQHLGLAVVAVEHRVRQGRRCCGQRLAGSSRRDALRRAQRRLRQRETRRANTATGALQVVARRSWSRPGAMPIRVPTRRAHGSCPDARPSARPVDRRCRDAVSRRCAALRGARGRLQPRPGSRCSSDAAAMRSSPRGRGRPAYMHTPPPAGSTCAVQMLLAFSRRMCCSRVCSAGGRPGRHRGCRC